MRILLVDDHAVVREGFAALLSAEPNIDVVGQAATCEAAMAQVRNLAPDVVLLDLALDGEDGFAILGALRHEVASPSVVILSSFGGDANVFRALEAGARGYVLKTAGIAEVLRVVRLAASGQIALSTNLNLTGLGSKRGVQLTDAERRVLGLMAEGDTNDEIAARFGMALATVKTHVHHVMQKLGAHTRTDAVAKARKLGILLH